MSKGISLHIGLNAVNPAHYSGWSGELTACEFDAQDMAALAKSKGFETHVQLTKAATRENFLAAFRKTVSRLAKGDIFFLTYSGHGGQLPDLNNEEADHKDETWCLFDGELVDDELYFELSKIPQSVRVVVLSDSCHSGTITKAAFYHALTKFSPPAFTNMPGFRAMPLPVAGRTYRDNKEFYDKLLTNKKFKNAKNKIKASVMLISGCQDNQYSSDGEFNGLFTATLLTTWNSGAFKGNYRKFHTKIIKNMPPDQTPNFFMLGAKNSDFESQTPFTV